MKNCTSLLSNRYRNDGKPSLRLNDTQKKAKSAIERKIADRTYTFEQVICPVCGRQRYELLAQKDRYGLPCDTVICKDCGLLITNPAMDSKSLSRFYSEDYRKLYTGRANADFSFFENQHKRGKRIANLIKQHAEASLQSKFVMEVGCGAGGILLAFREEGANVLGLDLGADYLEYGIEKHHLTLRQGSIENYAGEKPDIIIYSHVLEHTQLPKELLNIKKICHKETLIYIEVPGLLRLHTTYIDFRRYLQSAHLFLFSLGTLTNLLSKYGFTLIYGNENIDSVFRLINNTGGGEIHFNYYGKNKSCLIQAEKNRIWNRILYAFIKRNVESTCVFLLDKLGLYESVRKKYQKWRQKQ
jgi:2-polyprenyl-3-methyl-5-hydroxy-6-metoxy-1,4-benzoquinol methylase